MSAISLDLPVVRLAHGNHPERVLAHGVDAHVQAALDVAEAHQPLLAIVEPGIPELEDPARQDPLPERERQVVVPLVGCVLAWIETDLHPVGHRPDDTLTAY